MQKRPEKLQRALRAPDASSAPRQSRERRRSRKRRRQRSASASWISLIVLREEGNDSAKRQPRGIPIARSECNAFAPYDDAGVFSSIGLPVYGSNLYFGASACCVPVGGEVDGSAEISCSASFNPFLNS